MKFFEIYCLDLIEETNAKKSLKLLLAITF
jgi:hypothetical protein